MSNDQDHAAALQRAVDRQAIYREARSIADSDRVMAVYAAPEFDELHSDGQEWLVAIVEETKARNAAREAEMLAALRTVESWDRGASHKLSVGDMKHVFALVRKVIAKVEL